MCGLGLRLAGFGMAFTRSPLLKAARLSMKTATPQLRSVDGGLQNLIQLLGRAMQVILERQDAFDLLLPAPEPGA
jgi:hypothetical protein